MVFVSPSGTQTTLITANSYQLNHHTQQDHSSSQYNNALSRQQKSKDHKGENVNSITSSDLSPTSTITEGGNNNGQTGKKRRNSNIILDKNDGEIFSLSFLKKKPSYSKSDENIPSQEQVLQSPKLVRKRSGEIVKSSLKLNSLINSRSKSVPATPYSYNKSVHFGQNVDVRYFNERDKPIAVSANTSPILKPSSKARFDLHGFRKKLHNINHNSNFDDDDDDDDDIYDSLDEDFELSDDSESEDDSDDYEVSWEFKALNFEKIKYTEKFNNKEKLFLEKILIDDYNNSQLVGYVAVKNLAFEKRVHLRYTWDDWETIIEIEGFFNNESIPKILKRSGYDRFKFKIDLNNLKCLIRNKEDIHLKFAIRFNYNQEETWDNNSDKNYEISLTRRKYKTFHRPNTTMMINDYFDTPNITAHSKASKSTNIASGIEFDEINDYFNNYKSTLKSPDTPFPLKTGHSKNNDDVCTLNFSSINFDSNKDDSPVSPKTIKPDSTFNYTTSKPSNSSINNFSSYKNYNNHSHEDAKPSINSKSYQELLKTYCFYKSPNNSPVNSSSNISGFSSSSAQSSSIPSNLPSTISSFLSGSDFS